MDKLKQYFEEYLTKVDTGIHDVLKRFMTHVESRAKEDAAVTLLKGMGYSVTPPPSAAIPTVTDVVHQ